MYDIVWCRFPYDDSVNPGPIEHPCLVIETMVDSEGRPFVKLLAGTSNQGRTRPEYFPIELAHGAKCGLSKRTLINLENVGKRIPWAAGYFDRTRAHPLPAEAVTDFQMYAAYFQHETGWNPFSP